MSYVLSLLFLALWNLPVPGQDAQPGAEVPASEGGLSSSVSAAVETGTPSVVAVALFRSEGGSSGQTDPFETLLSGQADALLPLRFGGGIILKISPDRSSSLILTCAHLLEPMLPDDAEVAAFVCFGRHQTAPAKLHALDGRSDLAVLEVPISENWGKAGRFRSARMGDASRLSPGDDVVLLGDPLGRVEGNGPAAGNGMISRWDSLHFPPRRPEQADPLASLGTWLRVSATVGRDVSGAGLFNLRGELVGLTTVVPAVTRPRFEMAYILPCTPGIQHVVGDLMAGYEVSYGYLGVQLGSENSGSPLSANAPLLRTDPDRESAGVSVAQVTRNSPATRAGLQPRDRILRIDQNQMSEPFDALRRIALKGAGASVTLEVYRPGTRETLELTATLMTWPDRSGIPSYATARRKPAWRGLELVDATRGVSFPGDGFIPEIPHGVLIREVQSGTPAERAGLKIHEFIVKVGEELVETPEEFQDALQYWSKAVPVTLADGREVMIEEAR